MISLNSLKSEMLNKGLTYPDLQKFAILLTGSASYPYGFTFGKQIVDETCGEIAFDVLWQSAVNL